MHVAQPEHAHHQPVRAQRLPRGPAAAVQQPADDVAGQRRAVRRARPARAAVQRLRLRLHQPPAAAAARHAAAQLHHAPVAPYGPTCHVILLVYPIERYISTFIRFRFIIEVNNCKYHIFRDVIFVLMMEMSVFIYDTVDYPIIPYL